MRETQAAKETCTHEGQADGALRRHIHGAKKTGAGMRTSVGQQARASGEVARMQVRVVDRHGCGTRGKRETTSGGPLMAIAWWAAITDGEEEETKGAGAACAWETTR